MQYKIGDKINPTIRDAPAKSLNEAIFLLKQRGGTIVVEIGAMRMPLNHPLAEFHIDCCMDGHSTAHFASNSLQVYSVDIDPQVVNNTTKEIEKLGYLKHLQSKCMDGILYLQSFQERIDLLFLDAWDVGLPGFAEHHLDAYHAAKKNLHSKSLILIDDTDVDCVNGNVVFADGLSGKGKYVIPEAQKAGWKIIFSGRQTLLSLE